MTRRRPAIARCRRRFLKFFPRGFRDPTYLEWERDYKWATHERWESALGRATFRRLLTAGDFAEVAARAMSRPNWDTYASLLEFAEVLRSNLGDMKPRDMIDLQSFMWVQGSAEYD